MQQPFLLSTVDTKKIYGVHHGEWSWPTVVFVHGLTSTLLESKYVNTAKALEQHGIASIRYNLYSWEEDARKLHRSTMKQQGEDIDAICSHLKEKGVPHITLVGHSMGALSLLYAKKTNYDHVIFWDGSFEIGKYLDGEQVEGYDAILLDCGFAALMSKKMIDEVRTTNYVEKVASLDVPLSLIYAGAGVLLLGMEAYKQAAKDAISYVIEGAGHNFDEEGSEEALVARTVEVVTHESTK